MIFLACDHAGFTLKQHLLSWLTQQGYTCIDMGAESEKSVDYPDFAQSLCHALLESTPTSSSTTNTNITTPNATHQIISSHAQHTASSHTHSIASSAPHIGILLCGSGIGMSISANRFPRIRAALCTNTTMAQASRKHNDANVLCLGARIISTQEAKDIVEAFLHTSFEGERHIRRINKIDKAIHG